MEHRWADRKEIEYNDYVYRSAIESDIKELITKSTLLYIDGEPKVAYLDLEEIVDFKPIVSILNELRYDETERTGGLKTRSRVFGYQPRITLRRDFCSSTTLARDEKSANDVIADYAKQIMPFYKEAFPNKYDKHWSNVTKGYDNKKPIKEEWRIKDTFFTSGIINKNNPLKYHFDAGNLKDVCSCMLAFKKGIGGGVFGDA